MGLDPFFGQIAYVPDLGMDLIRQFHFDKVKGVLRPAGTVPSGPPGRRALGPRYIEFHPTLPVCYVVNELSSEVSVLTSTARPRSASLLAARARRCRRSGWCRPSGPS